VFSGFHQHAKREVRPGNLLRSTNRQTPTVSSSRRNLLFEKVQPWYCGRVRRLLRTYPEFIACSEIVITSMTLHSAFEDLIGSTLASISGLLAKIEYLSSLRNGDRSGTYEHWGLARVYGEQAAQQALAEAHQTLFLKVLRTSLRQLHQGAELGHGALSIPAQDYLEGLRKRRADLLPADLGGGSARHFSSVLQALSSLAKHSPPSTPLV
jgi:hypothetical protein